ncbi:chemotaxis protein CheD [Gracilimonas mengyeensis]|uniref:Probable chemoreceptor glutamine deamidase CheD n=1 Tax=Gracilimonas mengyeensis TaxID=1302730 RepID=A0A521D743_9BACT|nr:chemotaxis protein CheD [Gracilimonas mengyeensis]SMO67504.1 chemotaxis protein CheD [Gracilimonas mengyeensis]
MRKVVGVSDLKVSNNPGEIIITHALGSCLGITAFDPVAGVGGMVHVMLPLSKADPEKAKQKPAMYVDTGLQWLLHKVYDLGARKDNIEIIVAGGASMKRGDGDDYFKIGKRNFTTLRKLLWKNGFMIAHQDVGGNISRTMTLSVADGVVTINKQPINAPKRASSVTNQYIKSV